MQEEIPNDIQERTAETDELQETQDYTGLDKQGLLNKLRELAAAEDTATVTKDIFRIKDLFRQQAKDQYELKLRQFVAEGGNKDDFGGVNDPVDAEFEELMKKFNQKRAEQKKKKEKELQENLKAKQEIIEEIKKLSDPGMTVKDSFDKLQELQNRWRSTGPVPREQSEQLWQNYRHHTDQFFNVIKLSNEYKEIHYKKNLEIKTQLCEKAEALEKEPSLKKSFEALKSLQDRWKETGQVAKEDSDEIWARFKAAADKIHERKKAFVEEQKKRQQQHLEKKIALCEKAEEIVSRDLAGHNDLVKTEKELDALMEEWRKIGPVPEDQNEAIWKRFREARKTFQGKKEKHYSQARQEQSQNLKLKLQFIEKAEALKDSTDWNNTANELKRIQAEWKKIGPVPRKQSDKVWERFRAACDTFFNRREAHVTEEEKALQDEILKRKDFIDKVNSWSPPQDAAQAFEGIKEFQQEWQTFPPLQSRQKDALEKQFSSAVESKLNELKSAEGVNASTIERMRFEQMSKTPEGRETLQRERRTLQEKIRKIETEVTQIETNLGFFSRSKNAGGLLKEYEDKIEQGREQIKKLKEQLNLIPVPEGERVKEEPKKQMQKRRR